MAVREGVAALLASAGAFGLWCAVALAPVMAVEASPASDSVGFAVPVLVAVGVLFGSLFVVASLLVSEHVWRVLMLVVGEVAIGGVVMVVVGTA